MQNFVVRNRLAGEQQSHWDKTNKRNCHLKLCMSFVLSCPSAIFALRYGGFVTRKWLAAKKSLSCFKLRFHSIDLWDDIPDHKKDLSTFFFFSLLSEEYSKQTE